MSRVIVVCVSAMVSVASLEGLLRWASPNTWLAQVDASVTGRGWLVVNRHRSDRVFGYASLPNLAFDYDTAEWRTHVETNRDGFRGPEFTEAVKSIFVVGDSFVRAPQLPYDKVATFQPERMLAETGASYVVNNLGVESYSTVQYYNLLRVYAARWRPRVAIVVLWANDIPRDDQLERSPGVVRDEAGLIVALGPDTQFDAVPAPAWYEHAYLFWLGRHALECARAWRAGHPTRPADRSYWGVLEPENRQMFDATARYLVAAKTLCDGLGISLIVTALPIGNQVGPGQNGIGYHTTGSTPVAFERRTQYPDVNEEIARDHHVPYIDILADLRARAERGEKLYFTWDGHLNEQGNRRLAESMLRTLTVSGLVERSG